MPSTIKCPSTGTIPSSLMCDKDEQITRLEKRCPEKLEAFRTRWIPLEEAYIAATSVLEMADEIV